MHSTQLSSHDCEVLVVGAGPTGLMLAAQLLARGIHTRIVDKRRGPQPQSRAVSIHARTMEVFDSMGLAQAFLEEGHRVRRFRMYAGRRTVMNLDVARNDSVYGFMLHLPQSETEHLLRAHLHELGGRVEHGLELLRVSDEGQHVNATVADEDGRVIQLTADYVVGCDGAHSRVRHEMGVAFEGQPYPQDWLLADVALEGAGRDDESHAFFRPDGGPLVCLPMGAGRWRVVMPNAGEREGRAPSFEEIQDLIDQRAPRRIVASEPGWLGSFRCQLRSTRTYRAGHLLLAGDAAHIHSPAGGQGMNTGLSDANNLAWKLALVASGRASDQLLDTYAMERVPAASGVLGLSDRIVGWSTMRHPVKRAVRNTVLPVVTSLPPVQKRAASRLSQLSLAYGPGPIIDPRGPRRGPKVGHRLPDVDVRTDAGASRLFEVLRSGRHVLVVSAPDLWTVAREAGMDRYAGLVVAVQGHVGGARDSSFALVRPDGVLAVKGQRKDLGRVLEYFGTLVGELPRASEGGRRELALPVAVHPDDDVAGLALEFATHRVQGGQAHRLRLAGLEDRKVRNRDSDASCELGQGHLALEQHVVEADLDRHQTVSFCSSARSAPWRKSSASRTSSSPNEMTVQLGPPGSIEPKESCGEGPTTTAE